MYKDWTAKSRGVCLLTEITATVQLKTGYTEVATPYQSAGTSNSQFYVIFSNGGYQVTSTAPPTRIECFAVCKTARDTCCGTSHCLDDTLYGMKNALANIYPVEESVLSRLPFNGGGDDLSKCKISIFIFIGLTLTRFSYVDSMDCPKTKPHEV